MSTIEATTTSESGYTSVSRVGEYELTIDATNSDGPNPNEVLVVDYASCFVPALRVGAQKAGHDDLGRVEVDISAELDDDDDLTSITFDIAIAAALSEAEVATVVESAEDICHVHDALRDELHAEIDVTPDAF